MKLLSQDRVLSSGNTVRTGHGHFSSSTVAKVGIGRGYNNITRLRCKLVRFLSLSRKLCISLPRFHEVFVCTEPHWLFFTPNDNIRTCSRGKAIIHILTNDVTANYLSTSTQDTPSRLCGTITMLRHLRCVYRSVWCAGALTKHLLFAVLAIKLLLRNTIQ